MSSFTFAQDYNGFEELSDFNFHNKLLPDANISFSPDILYSLSIIPR